MDVQSDAGSRLVRVVFRADASHQIGSGHVMRCLTLADTLTQAGVECDFICRNHKGHLAEYIRAKGYICHLLHEDSEKADMSLPSAQRVRLQHADWLNVVWQVDARQTANILVDFEPDWLVVDHYALDDGWEQALQPYYRKLLVIDDLADRFHRNADVLLDQTLGRKESDYRSLVNPESKLLLGAEYALLRPEFAEWRDYSLNRRETPTLKNILVNLGGVDKDNVTGAVLDSLVGCQLPTDCEIVVVMGATAPHLESVQKQATQTGLNIRVLSGVSNMAELMANADFAIGAAGATTWERCCLGLPSIQIVLASNQQVIAKAMESVSAAIVVSTSQLVQTVSVIFSPEFQQSIKRMSKVSASIADGSGAKVTSELMRKLCA